MRSKISMHLTFLGTSCMVPTKQRNVAGVFLKFKTEGILFDCGEGTQRQMNIAGIKRTEVTKIFITHWHGDHISGIIGLLQTIGNNDYPPKIEIFGPQGTMEHMEHLMQACSFESRVDLKVHELNPKLLESCYNGKEFFVECAPLKHTVPCIGYRFVEKDRYKINMAKLKKAGINEGPQVQPLQEGKNITVKGEEILAKDVTSVVKGSIITYALDTAVCNTLTDLAKDADILITEASYVSDLEEKAKKHKHLTAQQAAQVASAANVKKLILTHFSQRYKDTADICAEAKEYFNETVCAEDFMKLLI